MLKRIVGRGNLYTLDVLTLLFIALHILLTIDYPFPSIKLP